MPTRRLQSEKGNAMLEFGLVVSVLIPLLFGTVSFGVNLGNMLQNVQITRDVAHMYGRGIDFSLDVNKNIAVDLVQGMGGMTKTGGNGVLILSQVRRIYETDCAAAAVLLADCTNVNKRVFANRIVIGNSALRTSNFGTPASPCTVNADGGIGSDLQLKQASCQATNFDDTVLTQEANEIAYVVEGYFATPNLDFLAVSGWGWGNGTAGAGTAGTYVRSIFGGL